MEDKIVYVPVSKNNPPIEEGLYHTIIEGGEIAMDYFIKGKFSTDNNKEYHSVTHWLKPTPLSELLKETAIEALQNERKEWLINCLVDCIYKLNNTSPDL